MSQPLLSVNGLMMRFGGLLAVNNVNLELYPQEIVSLIGPNGAGKTTVFNCLTGFYKPTGGTILLRDQHLDYAIIIFRYRFFLCFFLFNKLRFLHCVHCSFFFRFFIASILAKGTSAWTRKICIGVLVCR